MIRCIQMTLSVCSIWQMFGKRDGLPRMKVAQGLRAKFSLHKHDGQVHLKYNGYELMSMVSTLS